MCLGSAPRPKPLPAPRPTAPPPERTAKTVVTGRQRKKDTTGKRNTPVRRSGTKSLRIPRGMGSQGGNLNY